MLRRSSSNFNRNYKNILSTAQEAIHDIPSGSTLLVGGFGAAGSPHALCTALSKQTDKTTGNLVNKLSLYTNAGSIKGWGIGLLFENKQVSFIGCSHFGSNSFAEKQYLDGELEIEFVPQGSLAERMRAGGSGIPAFYTPTAAGTVLQQGGIFAKYCPETNRPSKFAEPKETRMINGKLTVLEHAIKGDYALVKAEIADRYGNCIMKRTSMNFNLPAAQAGKVCIVEAQKIVDYKLDPDRIHLPGVYVDRLVETKYETMVEHLKVIEENNTETKEDESTNDAGDKFFMNMKSTDTLTKKEHGFDVYLEKTERKPKSVEDRIKELSNMSTRERIQRRAALEITPFSDAEHPIYYLNLGIGIPTQVPDYVPHHINKQIQIQTENGLLGVGPTPTRAQLDADSINASKETITANPGASSFSSDQSFAMIRSGRMDVTILGGLEVSENGDLSNWIIPGKMTHGPGGALDLIAGTKRIVILMTHQNKKGQAKLLKKCTLPLTGAHCVHRVITEKAVFDFKYDEDKPGAGGRMILVEVAPEYLEKIDELKKMTDAKFEVSPELKEMEYSW